MPALAAKMAPELRRNEDVVKDMTPEEPHKTVPRSTRNKLGPKRLSYAPHAEETHDVKKRKVRKIHKHTHSNLLQIGDEDENTIVDQTGRYGQLSEYELKRLETIRENQAFLSSINLLEAKKEVKKLKRPSQRGLARSSTVKELPPARKSLRLQNKEAEVVPAHTESKVTTEQSSAVTKLFGPQPMEPINMEESKLPLQILELSFEGLEEDRKVVLDLERYRSTLQKMRINEDQVAKVVMNRIYCAAFHPSCSSLFMAAGDTIGNVGLWGLNSTWGDDGVLLFKPHARCVSCMAFSRTCPVQLLSGSYDGSLRCMDVEKAIFDDVYDFDDGLKSFDFMSHDCSTLVVGNFYGSIAIVDRRAPGNSHQSLHSLNSMVLRCIHVHPVARQYLLVAENKTVKIYDNRYLKSKSKAVSELYGHSLSITSAYFSPSTGNRVLTSCSDDRIRIFDTSESAATPPLLTSIRHNMHTGRWLSKISAVWDPKQDDCFVAGSMLRPRRLQVFHESGREQHTFTDQDNFNTVLPVTVFHPTRNALLGGNASGRLHVFTD
ncbi:WD repeat-containing protein 76 isoform X2 [Takifugu rubripes]|uniref:WD repeat-containing protein 76 isoform X2 n=1 Tax=Takifugu rubripes TaxID=31033 RepID=UPI001145D269|nr:WD repeat-containing protein 76 isoform X2 [Takifugu rubripes]